MSDEERIASKFRRLIELREKRDETKELAETAETEYREYEAELFEEIEHGPLKGTRNIDLGPPYGTVRFTPRETKFGRVTDSERAIEWLEQHGKNASMTQVKVSKARLNEMVRERLELGQPMPDGIDWYASRGITITRPKGTKGRGLVEI
jgi:hypothetical protein